MKRNKIIILTLACLTSLICVSSAYAKPSEKEAILRVCNQLFGAPVDEKQDLFEVNQFYVLRFMFDNRGQLEELAVEPKCFFEESHPDWEEPETSLQECGRHELGGESGIAAVLHTRGQNLQQHIHLHCIVTCARQSEDRPRRGIRTSAHFSLSPLDVGSHGDHRYASDRMVVSATSLK